MVFETFNLWKSAFFSPARTFAEQRKKASYRRAMLWAAECGAIYVLALRLFPAEGVLSETRMTAIHVFFLFGMVGVILAMLCVALAFMLSVSAINILLFPFAKLLGGKGTFRQQFHIVALSITSVWFALSVASSVSLIPVIGEFLFYLCLLALSFYYLYSLTIALREAHGYGTFEAALTWLFLPLVIATVLLLKPLVYGA